MSDLGISAIVFAAVFAAALVGAGLRRMLPEHHLTSESRDAMKLALGLIGTMAALVLGLMVASAKGAYDTQKSEVTQMSAKLILLDRALGRYGAQTQEIRKRLRASVERALAQIWAEEGSAAAKLEPTLADLIHGDISALVPTTDAQRTAQARALSLSADLEETRWLLFEQAGSAISMPFLVVLVAWLTIIFIGFGLLAPSNLTVLATLLLCAVCVSSSMLLILELDRPFNGLIRIPDAPVRSALEVIGR